MTAATASDRPPRVAPESHCSCYGRRADPRRPFPTPFASRRLGGGTWDPASGLLYLSAQRADVEQADAGEPPIILAYRILSEQN